MSKDEPDVIVEVEVKKYTYEQLCSDLMDDLNDGVMKVLEKVKDSAQTRIT